MSNRFVQYKPLDYTPVTEPLEILKESLVNRRKLIDVMEDEQDKLALVKAQGIEGTDWQNKAVGVNKVLKGKLDEVSGYLIDNPSDLYGAKRKLRELKNYIAGEAISGELGAINSARAQYVKQVEELQKEAGKKGSFSFNRLGQVKQNFLEDNQNIGKFNPETGTYENARSLGLPVAEYDVYERLTDVIKNTPEYAGIVDIRHGSNGLEIYDIVTKEKRKDSDQLIQNFKGSLSSDPMFLADLDFQTNQILRQAKRLNPDMQVTPEQAALLKEVKFNQILQQAGGYGYKNIDEERHFRNNPMALLEANWKYKLRLKQMEDAKDAASIREQRPISELPLLNADPAQVAKSQKVMNYFSDFKDLSLGESLNVLITGPFRDFAPKIEKALKDGVLANNSEANEQNFNAFTQAFREQNPNINIKALENIWQRRNDIYKNAKKSMNSGTLSFPVNMSDIIMTAYNNEVDKITKNYVGGRSNDTKASVPGISLNRTEGYEILNKVLRSSHAKVYEMEGQQIISQDGTVATTTAFNKEGFKISNTLGAADIRPPDDIIPVPTVRVPMGTKDYYVEITDKNLKGHPMLARYQAKLEARKYGSSPQFTDVIYPGQSVYNEIVKKMGNVKPGAAVNVFSKITGYDKGIPKYSMWDPYTNKVLATNVSFGDDLISSKYETVELLND